MARLFSGGALAYISAMTGSSSNIPRRPPGPGDDAPAPPTQVAPPVEAAEAEETPAEVEAPSESEAAAQIDSDVDAEVEASSDVDMGLDDETAAPSLRAGAAVIHGFWKTLPGAPGVYRMTGAAGEVLYVGKARNLKKRVASYARGIAPTTRIARMIAETAAMEFVTTETETEALLLEANLIKQLKPRYNVLLRDDKSFPYILISGDHAAPQIAKHRGARSRKGDYYGPFANAGAVNRTVNALQRAFLLRSCSDSYYDNRTRPCLLYQIKRCSAPCTGEISLADYAELVEEARGFLCGRSNAVKRTLAAEMQAAAEALEFERAARYRDRLAALSAVQTSQDINPQSVEEADVFAIDLQAGQFCIEVFFFRNAQNWGNRAYFPRADKSLAAAEVLASFIAQFYDDKPCPRLVLLSQPVDDQDLLAEALSARAGRRVELVVPQRGEKRDLVEHAARNAREALGRRLADTASQHKLLGSLGAAFGLAEAPRRIEVYDNSHIRGANAVGAMIVTGAAGFMKAHYRTFNIRSLDLTPGDDYAMMREVLRRRFARLIKEAPRPGGAAAQAGGDGPNRACADLPPEAAELPADADADDAAGEEPFPAWPDLVIIDGGRGQLEAARATLAELGLNDVALVGIAKGPDRDAGRESFFMVGRGPFKLAPRDPALYFVQRMRDEAHRFAIGTHRARRKKDLVRSPLDEVPGIGPARKRALLMHFGTAKAVSRASLDDLRRVPGVNAATAKVVYDHFHDEAS